MQSHVIMGNSAPSHPSHCRIVVVGARSGDACLTELSHLPKEAIILGQGKNLVELQQNCELFTEANVLLNVSGDAAVLGPIINAMPFLQWIHSITAGVDHIICPEMRHNPELVLTNAKGVYSSSLAEYVICVCLYFAKSIYQLQENRINKKWDRFDMKELKGSTMGIVGYGDIGANCAKAAKSFGMKVVALRKRPELNANDSNVDHTYGSDQLLELMAVSDYIVIACALTSDTTNLISATCLEKAKKDAILINISRGPVIDETALIHMLTHKKGPIIGAALDVFNTEPLPLESPLWELNNVLISPHNADKTATFRHESIKFFTDNCRRFLNNQPLESIVSLSRGY